MVTYRNQINKIKLTPEEEIELFNKYKEGDKFAGERLIINQLPLVMFIAKKYVYSNIDIDDLIQEGNDGLIYALSKWDPTKSKFNSYAGQWIRQRIQRYIETHNHAIKYPNSLFNIAFKVKTYVKDYFTINGYDPTDKEIIEHFKKDNLDKEKLFYINNLNSGITSINVVTCEGSNADNELVDLLSDKNKLMKDEIENTKTTNLVTIALKELEKIDSKYTMILQLHFGIKTNYPADIKQIAKIMNISQKDATLLIKEAKEEIKIIIERIQGNDIL